MNTMPINGRGVEQPDDTASSDTVSSSTSLADEPRSEQVRELTGPSFVSLPETAHLLEPIIERAERDPSVVVAAYRNGAAFVDVTAGELYERVRQVAKGLLASSVSAGDRVALMSRTRLEWMVSDYAINAVGAVTVPIYETSSAEQVQWILADSGASMAVVESLTMRVLVGDLPNEDTGLQEVLVIDEGGIDDLVERGQAVSDDALDERIGAITTSEIATIIYTSGTTGRPKGCVLTHGNLRANVIQTLDAVRPMLGADERTLLFLPLAHSFAKIIALVGFEYGVVGVFATDLEHLPEELSLAEPTMIVAVPRVFEKVLDAARRQSHSRHLGRVFDRAADVAVDYSQQQATGRPKLRTRIEHRLYDALVYRKIRDAFGGSLRFAFSGGSPLDERLAHFFNGVGIRVFEGYGLTETSPTLTVNREGAWRPGTVGQPLAGTRLRLARDGEILAQGPQVFSGYWRAPESTREVFTRDGWFRTGDVGELDDSFLKITGRSKELIVTAGGKNVAPAPLEARLRAHPLINHALVVGDNRRFISALVVIDEPAFAAWQRERSGNSRSVAESVQDPELRAAIQEAVDGVNESVSRAESIRSFAILPVDLTVAGGELTPTLKVRRRLVEQRYADVIDDLYM